MKVSVYDTYVTRKDGKVMHFDILVPDPLGDLYTIVEMENCQLAKA
jgi:hypothetical protein